MLATVAETLGFRTRYESIPLVILSYKQIEFTMIGTTSGKHENNDIVHNNNHGRYGP